MRKKLAAFFLIFFLAFSSGAEVARAAGCSSLFPQSYTQTVAPVFCKQGLIIGQIVCETENSINTAASEMYCNLVEETSFLEAMRALIALYITLWGLAVVMGVVRTSRGEVTQRLLYLTFIFVLATNPAFFTEYLYKLVMSAPKFVMGVIFSVSDPNSQGNFSLLKVFSNLLLSVTGRTIGVIVISAVFFFPFGGPLFLFFYLLLIAAIIYALMRVVVTYLMAVLGLALLMILAPIFLPMALFSPTRPAAQEWVNFVISFALQPVFILLFLLMLSNALDDQGEELEKFAHGVKDEDNPVPPSSNGNGNNNGNQQVGKIHWKWNAMKIPLPKLPVLGDKLGVPIPWFVYEVPGGSVYDGYLKLMALFITTMLMCWLIISFMRVVPQFALDMAGNFRFPRLGASNAQDASRSFGAPMNLLSAPNMLFSRTWQSQVRQLDIVEMIENPLRRDWGARVRDSVIAELSSPFSGGSYRENYDSLRLVTEGTRVAQNAVAANPGYAARFAAGGPAAAAAVQDLADDIVREMGGNFPRNLALSIARRVLS